MRAAQRLLTNPQRASVKVDRRLEVPAAIVEETKIGNIVRDLRMIRLPSTRSRIARDRRCRSSEAALSFESNATRASPPIDSAAARLSVPPPFRVPRATPDTTAQRADNCPTQFAPARRGSYSHRARYWLTSRFALRRHKHAGPSLQLPAHCRSRAADPSRSPVTAPRSRPLRQQRAHGSSMHP